jgi:hypothetical protein
VSSLSPAEEELAEVAGAWELDLIDASRWIPGKAIGTNISVECAAAVPTIEAGDCSEESLQPQSGMANARPGSIPRRR